MPILHRRFCPNEKEVAAKVMDGEAILINLSNGIYYSMDKVGSLIWEMIERSFSLEEMVATIGARYNVSVQEFQTDIERLLEQLVEENLVIEADCASPHGELEMGSLDYRAAYETPQLNIYRDMGDLLALDPPVPGLAEMNWKESDDK